jgi:hypothetical protein
MEQQLSVPREEIKEAVFDLPQRPIPVATKQLWDQLPPAMKLFPIQAAMEQLPIAMKPQLYWLEQQLSVPREEIKEAVFDLPQLPIPIEQQLSVSWEPPDLKWFPFATKQLWDLWSAPIPMELYAQKELPDLRLPIATEQQLSSQCSHAPVQELPIAMEHQLSIPREPPELRLPIATKQLWSSPRPTCMKQILWSSQRATYMEQLQCHWIHSKEALVFEPPELHWLPLAAEPDIAIEVRWAPIITELPIVMRLSVLLEPQDLKQPELSAPREPVLLEPPDLKQLEPPDLKQPQLSAPREPISSNWLPPDLKRPQLSAPREPISLNWLRLSVLLEPQDLKQPQLSALTESISYSVKGVMLFVTQSCCVPSINAFSQSVQPGSQPLSSDFPHDVRPGTPKLLIGWYCLLLLIGWYCLLPSCYSTPLVCKGVRRYLALGIELETSSSVPV